MLSNFRTSEIYNYHEYQSDYYHCHMLNVHVTGVLASLYHDKFTTTKKISSSSPHIFY